jgi:hypothetical protein
MSKTPPKLKGRPAFDRRGNSTWEWVGENESGTQVSTETVKALGDGLSLETAPEMDTPDPNKQPISAGKTKTSGRSLDDMVHRRTPRK